MGNPLTVYSPDYSSQSTSFIDRKKRVLVFEGIINRYDSFIPFRFSPYRVTIGLMASPDIICTAWYWAVNIWVINRFPAESHKRGDHGVVVGKG